MSLTINFSQSLGTLDRLSAAETRMVTAENVYGKKGTKQNRTPYSRYWQTKTLSRLSNQALKDPQLTSRLRGRYS